MSTAKNLVNLQTKFDLITGKNEKKKKKTNKGKITRQIEYILKRSHASANIVYNVQMYYVLMFMRIMKKSQNPKIITRILEVLIAIPKDKTTDHRLYRDVRCERCV